MYGEYKLAAHGCTLDDDFKGNFVDLLKRLRPSYTGDEGGEGGRGGGR